LIKFENGASVTITGGNNIGRVGVIQHVEKHPGSFDIVHVRDANGHVFATRLNNVFVIGEGKKPVISLLPDRGIKKTLIEEREERLRHEYE
jgi:small subunit ribosomal protein S4e